MINYRQAVADPKRPSAINQQQVLYARLLLDTVDLRNAPMKTLAEISLDYVWLILFGSDETIDPHYAVKMQESLPEYFASMSQEEKAAFARAGAETRARLLAEPDEHGYTPRKLVTDEQKAFLDALSSGDIFEEWK